MNAINSVIRAAFFSFACAISAAQTERTADADWAAIARLREARTPAASTTASVQERAREKDEFERKITAMLFDFCGRYPDDARLWEAILLAHSLKPTFIASFKPAYESAPMVGNLVIDAKAKTEWERTYNGLAPSLALADDTVPANRVVFEMFSSISADLQRIRLTGEGSWLDLRERIMHLAATYPDRPHGARLAQSYASAVLKCNPGLALEPLWGRFATSPNEELSAAARKRLGAGELKLDPFTAVDGRPVDVAQMRGKIVLVDFWSTYCGPCIAAFPELKSIYDKYHAQGFEIIGITLQDPGDKQKLLDCVKKYDLPWPQYFDGKRWQADPAVANKIDSTPTTYLLDPAGKVVAFGNLYVQLKPSAIEEKVRELLRLPPLGKAVAAKKSE